MKPNLFTTIAAIFPLLSLSASAQFTASDDFTDSARDTAKWGLVDPGTPDVEWIEAGGRLNFSSPNPSFGVGQSSRIWQARSPGYTNDWSITVDVQLGDIDLSESEGVTVGIGVANATNPDDHLLFALQLLSPDGSSTLRQIQAESFMGGASAGRSGIPFSGRSVQLRVSYDAHSRMLTAAYLSGAAFKPIAYWNSALWIMNANSTFRLSVDGQAFGAAVALGQAVADNFALREASSRNLGVLNGGDDFNDRTLDAAKWGSLDTFMGVGELDEVNGGVRYTTLGEVGSEDDYDARLWFPGAGDFSKSWTAQVDVSLPELKLSEGHEAQIGLVVLNLADPGDRATVSLDLSADQGTSSRRFLAGILRDGVAFSDLDVSAPTSSTAAALRARWDAPSQTLFFEYDVNGAVGGYQWTVLASYPVNTGDVSWELGTGSRFQVGIFGESYRGTTVLAAAGVMLDNFQVSSDSPVLPLKLTTVESAGVKAKLTWVGGVGPFQIQRRDVFNTGVWANAGSAVNTRSVSVDSTGKSGFFRIVDLGQ